MMFLPILLAIFVASVNSQLCVSFQSGEVPPYFYSVKLPDVALQPGYKYWKLRFEKPQRCRDAVLQVRACEFPRPEVYFKSDTQLKLTRRGENYKTQPLRVKVYYWCNPERDGDQSISKQSQKAGIATPIEE